MLRLAQLTDIPLLTPLIQTSARVLGKGYYTEMEIESAITYIYGVDTELIHDQTYYLIEKNKQIIACGGWSKRLTLFGGDQCEARQSGYLDPQKDPAKIRAFFVSPAHARQGLGKRLLEACEKAALENGFTEIEMMATLPGVDLYQAFGYKGMQPQIYTLPNGVGLRLVQMRKKCV